MRSRARHWSRTALAVAVLFGVMAAGSRILLGAWPFDGALELSVLCVAFSGYFHVIARRRLAALPDPSVLLDEAFQDARAGRVDDAITLLTKAIGQNRQLWQAFQYRGELYLVQQDFARAAADFDEAIRLAPEEKHLYALREQAQ
jgi:tetratricopeptide (TPR) repeat protein